MKRKININININRKHFIVTAVLILLFIMSTFIIQSLYFERLYINKKRNDLKNDIEKFKSDYNKEGDSSKIIDLINEYEESYNIKIIIQDNRNKNKMISTPPKSKEDSLKLRQLTEFIQGGIRDNPKQVDPKGHSRAVTITRKERDIEAGNLISIIPNTEKEETIFAILSLQHVNEAMSVIEQFYPYFYIGTIFFTAILVLMYLDSLKKANTKLQDDIEKERKLEKMRREFVDSISHELKTPISLIDGYAIALKDDIFEGKDRDYYLNIISDEARKMGRLVSDMLDLSYLESGNFNLIYEEFDAATLIQFTVRKYESHILEKAVNMQLNLIEGIIVYADWNRMEQVLTNFITNALRHVNEKGTIYISMVKVGEAISVEIENTGFRIPEEDLEKVWDKFYKIDKSRSRKLGGTGIGLSIVKKILMLHKFTFGVVQTDRGVKFYFVIPINPYNLK